MTSLVSNKVSIRIHVSTCLSSSYSIIQLDVKAVTPLSSTLEFALLMKLDLLIDSQHVKVGNITENVLIVSLTCALDPFTRRQVTFKYTFPIVQFC